METVGQLIVQYGLPLLVVWAIMVRAHPFKQLQPIPFVALFTLFYWLGALAVSSPHFYPGGDPLASRALYAGFFLPFALPFVYLASWHHCRRRSEPKPESKAR